MTDEEKLKVGELRARGLSPTNISHETGLSVNTIKTYLRRNNVQAGEKVEVQIKYETKCDVPRCKNCGCELIRFAGRRQKNFCNDRCRMAWWNSHQDQVNKKAIYEYECANCHKAFTAYGNSHRKYCCHECYLVDRYGGIR